MTIPKIKVTTILGTRPEIIRLSTLLRKFDLIFDHRLIHTGQNSQDTLSKVFFDDLQLRAPDNFLAIDSKSLGGFLGDLFVKVEKEFTTNRPDAIVILGDTNSGLSGLIARRMGIPIYHLEAGNRSFDPNVPEEVNRRVIDHFSDFNLAYSHHARRNLLTEGIHPRFTSVIGSPMNEVILGNIERLESSLILKKLNLETNEYFLVSIHRQENVDDSSRLESILECLNLIAKSYDLPILVSTHPRTRNKLQSQSLKIDNHVQFLDPFGFFDYLSLQKNSRLVISDSGSVSEEASILGFRAVTIRNSMERPEALESGNIVLSGIEPEMVLKIIEVVLNSSITQSMPEEYAVKDTSSRVINFMISTFHEYRTWIGLR